MSRILIVGGVAGGASAAARARRMSEDSEIILFDRGEYISFANCGLPYHIGGEIPERDALLLQTPESFKARFNVEVRNLSEVESIDPAAKTIQVRNRVTGESYTEAYDQLLLSPGAAPLMPPIPGLDNPMTHSLRNVPDMDRIIEQLDFQKPTHATVVGGGYIGLEMAEALRERNLKVTMLELADQVMGPVDREMAAMAHAELRQHDIDLRLKTALQSVEHKGDRLTLSLSDGNELETQLLIMAVGVKPEVSLARDAGLKLGTTGGIWVDNQMQTSDPNIWAVGDAVEVTDFVSGKPILVPLAGPANRQGRIAADNMLGGEVEYQNTQGTGICKIFDLAVASTGLNEKQLSQSDVDYDKVYVHPNSHAGYYPGAQPVSMKLLFNKADGKILGAQAVGKDGIDKRIDVMAVAIRAGMTVYDLEHLELTYAPPYGSAKDVVNLAGFVASNMLRGDTPLAQHHELDEMRDDQVLLDVRNLSEPGRTGAFETAIKIPLDELRDRLDELPKDKEILVTCMVGLRGNVATRLLLQHGFKARNVTGGYKTYRFAYEGK